MESALVIPLGLLLLAGGFELARGILYYHTAEKAARGVTRYMARLPETMAGNSALAASLMGAQITTPTSSTITSAIQTRTVDGYTFKVVQVSSSLTYDFPLLSIVPRASQITFSISHEQRYIGS